MPLRYSGGVTELKMASATHNGEWVVEAGLTERTGLSKGQIKSYRLNLWIEGVHFKHLTAQGDAGNPSGLQEA